MLPTPQRVIERALTKVEPDGNCLVSLYSVGSHGYAQIGWWADGKNHMRLVHRIAWEHANGRIAKDMYVDHICHNLRCLNIQHLRLLTPQDNSRRNQRGRDFPVGWICYRGHPAENQKRRPRGNGIYTWTCAECLRITQREYQRRKYAEQKASR